MVERAVRARFPKSGRAPGLTLKTDGGAQFVAHRFQEGCRTLGISLMATRKRRRGGNGMVESWNGLSSRTTCGYGSPCHSWRRVKSWRRAWSTTTRRGLTRRWSISRRASALNRRRRNRTHDRNDRRPEAERPSPNPTLRCTNEKGARHCFAFESRWRCGFDPYREWTRGDLNPRPLLCESSDLPLIYVPNNPDRAASIFKGCPRALVGGRVAPWWLLSPR